MKKAWVYNRKNIKGWWIGWYEGGKKKAKALPSKALAKHLCQIKYTQLNSDVFTGFVNFDWHQMVERYRKAKQVQGLRETSIYESILTLGHFQRLIGPDFSKQINQNILDKFILDRGREVKKTTLNKDIKNLNAFLHLGHEESSHCPRSGNQESQGNPETNDGSDYTTGPGSSLSYSAISHSTSTRTFGRNNWTASG